MHYPIIFDDEIKKNIEIDNIEKRYTITNYGRVIDEITGKELSQSMTKDGYMRVGLRTINGTYKQFLVHRLVMMEFESISNPDQYQVNHIHGIKNFNHYESELEWVTEKENMRHAFFTGLNNNIRENHTNSILTDKQVHYICKCLSDGEDFDYIEKSLIDVNSSNIKDLIRSIYERKSWNTISSQYTFHDYGNRRNNFTDDQVEIICKELEKGNNYKIIASALNINIDAMTRDEQLNFNNTISNIRCGKYYKHISSKYNFDESKLRFDQKFTIDQIHQICRCIEQRMTTSDILEFIGIHRDKISCKEYDILVHAVSRIRNKKAFNKISSLYSF